MDRIDQVRVYLPGRDIVPEPVFDLVRQYEGVFSTRSARRSASIPVAGGSIDAYLVEGTMSQIRVIRHPDFISLETPYPKGPAILLSAHPRDASQDTDMVERFREANVDLYAGKFPAKGDKRTVEGVTMVLEGTPSPEVVESLERNLEAVRLGQFFIFGYKQLLSRTQ